MEHRGEKRGKQAGSGIRRRATFHEGLEHFVKYYVFTIKKKMVGSLGIAFPLFFFAEKGIGKGAPVVRGAGVIGGALCPKQRHQELLLCTSPFKVLPVARVATPLCTTEFAGRPKWLKQWVSSL